MARLTHHLPAEPVPFLIKVLNKFDEKAKKPVSMQCKFNLSQSKIHLQCLN